MKIINISLFSIFLIFSYTLNASETQNLSIHNADNLTCDQIIQTGDKELIAKRGCCSWHGGVCGCENGRQVCCDGTYSPSCTCHKETPIPDPNT